jgi:hypothetical protein
VLRKIFEPKRDEVAAEWRKLHNEEPIDLYFLDKCYSGDKIKKSKLGGKERCIQCFDGET